MVSLREFLDLLTDASYEADSIPARCGVAPLNKIQWKKKTFIKVDNRLMQLFFFFKQAIVDRRR